MARKIIIDADPGIGDAVAIALALVDPNLDVVGLTPTAGCVSGPQATHNLQAIVEQMDPPKWPRMGSSEVHYPQIPINVGAADVSPAALNGESGLGDWTFQVAELHHSRHAAKLMIDLLRAAPGEITLLTFGPLSNVEVACERAPEFLDQLKSLVCLGGAIQSPGDATAVAEFNVLGNPEAAQNVFRMPGTKTLAPLDVSNQVVLTFAQLNTITSGRASRLNTLLQSILPFALRANHQHLGLEGVPLKELVGLATISRPDLFRTKTMAIEVETQGEFTRGMTVCDRREFPRWQATLEVVHEVDVEGVFGYFDALVARAAQ